LRVGVFVPPMPSKPSALMSSVHRAFYNSGHESTKFNSTSGTKADLILLYGWGGNKQQDLIKNINCNYVAFDLGYWDRSGLAKRKWRISINGWHSPDLILNGFFNKKKRPIPDVCGDVENPHGHILLVGSSPKSLKVGAAGWSKRMASEIRDKFPKSKIVYRPKPQRVAEKVDCDDVSFGCDIQSAMSGAKLVVCHHSNVSVDAAIAGVPCVAEDGAGSAIYPKKLDDYESQPSTKDRRIFLSRLAWWQWSMNEINNDPVLFTSWIEKQINAI
jgi:hypothetical protein